MTTALTGITGKHFQECMDLMKTLSSVKEWMNLDDEALIRARIHLCRIDGSYFDDSALTEARPYILMSGEPFSMEATSAGPTWKFAGKILLCLVDDIPAALRTQEQEALIAFWNATDAIIEELAGVEDGSGTWIPMGGQPYMPERNSRLTRATQGDALSRVLVLASGIQ